MKLKNMARYIYSNDDDVVERAKYLNMDEKTEKMYITIILEEYENYKYIGSLITHQRDGAGSINYDIHFIKETTDDQKIVYIVKEIDGNIEIIDYISGLNNAYVIRA